MRDCDAAHTSQEVMCPECRLLRQDVATIAVLYAEAQARKERYLLHGFSENPFNPAHAGQLQQAAFSLHISRDDAHWKYVDHLARHLSGASTPDAAETTGAAEMGRV